MGVDLLEEFDRDRSEETKGRTVSKTVENQGKGIKGERERGERARSVRSGRRNYAKEGRWTAKFREIQRVSSRIKFGRAKRGEDTGRPWKIKAKTFRSKFREIR